MVAVRGGHTMSRRRRATFRSWRVPCALAACAVAATSVRADDDVEFRRSLPTESDPAAWAGAGFRLSLGYAYGWVHGLGALPEARTHEVVIRAGARLDADWSVLGSLQYAFADDGFSALSYLVTLDPTWHLGAGFEAAIGIGFGGLAGLVGDELTEIADVDPDAPHSITLTDTTPPLGSCDGQGPAALVRVAWSLVLDDIWAVALHAEGHARWIGCEEASGRVDADTGEPIVTRQWWGMLGANLGLSFVWR